MTAEGSTYADEVRSIVTGFDYETCAECGHDLERHSIAPDVLGHAHAWCLEPHPEDCRACEAGEPMRHTYEPPA